MFKLKELPSCETLDQFSKRYANPDIEGLHIWLAWASATNEMLTAF